MLRFFASCKPSLRAQHSAEGTEQKPKFLAKPAIHIPFESRIMPPAPAWFVGPETEPSVLSLAKPIAGGDPSDEFFLSRGSGDMRTRP